MNQSSAPNDGQAVLKASETVEQYDSLADQQENGDDFLTYVSLRRDTDLTSAAENAAAKAIRRYDDAQVLADRDIVFHEIVESIVPVIGICTTDAVIVADGCVPVSPSAIEGEYQTDSGQEVTTSDDPTYHIAIDRKIFEDRCKYVFDGVVRHELAHAIERERTGTVYGEESPRFLDICRVMDASHPSLDNNVIEMRRAEARAGKPIYGESARELYEAGQIVSRKI